MYTLLNFSLTFPIVLTDRPNSPCDEPVQHPLDANSLYSSQYVSIYFTIQIWLCAFKKIVFIFFNKESMGYVYNSITNNLFILTSITLNVG